MKTDSLRAEVGSLARRKHEQNHSWELSNVSAPARRPPPPEGLGHGTEAGPAWHPGYVDLRTLSFLPRTLGVYSVRDLGGHGDIARLLRPPSSPQGACAPIIILFTLAAHTLHPSCIHPVAYASQESLRGTLPLGSLCRSARDRKARVVEVTELLNVCQEL
jgi:hypothetical protein